jgi:hypothetical protein
VSVDWLRSHPVFVSRHSSQNSVSLHSKSAISGKWEGRIAVTGSVAGGEEGDAGMFHSDLTRVRHR